jgi:hypothetical protein
MGIAQAMNLPSGYAKRLHDRRKEFVAISSSAHGRAGPASRRSGESAKDKHDESRVDARRRITEVEERVERSETEGKAQTDDPDSNR